MKLNKFFGVLLLLAAIITGLAFIDHIFNEIINNSFQKYFWVLFFGLILFLGDFFVSLKLLYKSPHSKLILVICLILLLYSGRYFIVHLQHDEGNIFSPIQFLNPTTYP